MILMIITSGLILIIALMMMTITVAGIRMDS